MSLSTNLEEPTDHRLSPYSAVVVLSDRIAFRDCVVEYLHRHGFPQAIGRARWEALNRAAGVGLHGLLLIDLGQETENPDEVIRKLHERWPAATAVAIGTPMQLAAQAADADGWIDLSGPGRRLPAVAQAVSRPHSGRVKFAAPPEVEHQLRTWRSLTRRQRQVLALLGCGLDNKRLAEVLGVSARAVKLHVSALIAKFKVDNRTGLAIIACQAGLRRPSVRSSVKA